MAQDVQYKDLVASIVDIGDEPATVVANIEDHADPSLIGISPASFDVGEMLPISCSLLDDFVPDRERGRPFRVLLAGFPNFLPADDPHKESSQFAKFASSHFGKVACPEQAIVDRAFRIVWPRLSASSNSENFRGFST